MKFYENKHILITGAANGLGKAMAEFLIGWGAHLILVDKDKEGLTRFIEKGNDNRGSIRIYEADISQYQSVEGIVKEAFRDQSTLDMLINNAAVSHQGRIDEMNAADFEWVIRTNLLGSYYCTKCLLPCLKQSGQGKIINIISGIAFHVLPGFSAYGSSKAALRGFTQSLRAELYDQGIDVVGVYPGPIKTTIPMRSRHVNEAYKTNELKYLATKGYEPTYFARIILQNTARGKRDIYLGWEVKTGHWLSRLFPGLLTYFINRKGDTLGI